MTASNIDELVMTLGVGSLLAGKYQIERQLGTGGMGVVVAARHVHLDEIVAIKILLPHLVENADLVTRFLREGRAMIKIRSEHAVKINDVGLLENGAPYLAMEYLDGEDLSKLVRRRGPFPISEAVDLVLQACEAVAEAHALGIVHRDLKPANLFLTQRADGSPSVKVLDFGISKNQNVPGNSDFEITKTQAVMGSPRYMSPEQMRSARSVDHRTDIWALGTILYELIAGAPPFHADTMTELCAQILTDQPTPLTQARANCPPILDVAIAKALAKNPADRHQNLAEFAGAIAMFASPESKSSALRVARVLKVEPTHAQIYPGSTLPLDVQAPPELQALSISSSGTSSPGTSAPTRVERVGTSEDPAAHAQVRTGMVWGSPTGPQPQKRSFGFILLAALAGAMVLLSLVAVLALVVLKKSQSPPVAAVEASQPVVAAPPPTSSPPPTPAPPPEPAPVVAPEIVSVTPSETKTAPTPTAKVSQPTVQKTTKTTTTAKTTTKPGSKDPLPFSGRH